ncbi:hypothetical protein CLV56_0296 [Mumia flava]|uniref:TIGR01777 family protein n=1 Tax=Mumia flava TaxID=1348852 RepID=A0A0B2B2P1_9ACTN|nr:TIGR01777 family oxidoreductase [Mumia flava]PJJ56092.1 hypothetical protein CLV56_0296 [Mumia flava]
MRFCIAGASGFLGQALAARLESDGHTVVRLVRRAAEGPGESRWDPAKGVVDHGVIARSHVVVNLSGAPIAHWPWTEAYRRELVESRLRSTETLARAVAQARRPPVLLSSSGINAYGDDRGTAVLDESSDRGAGFLADLVRRWEETTGLADRAGARVCLLRTSPVLDRSGGLLRLMLIPFRLGLGARLGSGEQYFPMISLRDWVGAVQHLATTDDARGPYNLVAPTPATNAQFTAALAAALHRPAVLRAPSFALRAALGGLSVQALGSLRSVPDRLQASGYTFADTDVDAVIASALADPA